MKFVEQKLALHYNESKSFNYKMVVIMIIVYYNHLSYITSMQPRICTVFERRNSALVCRTTNISMYVT